jgi:uncharacterized damage-inducible protein DinB
MTKKIRLGAIGALLDEYERAISDLKNTIAEISDHKLTVIMDSQTTDESCRSIQTILSHVVHSGYGYATNIHNLKGHAKQRPHKTFHLTGKEYLNDLTAMFDFTEIIFEEFEDTELEQLDNSLKIKMSWEQLYDIEQLMEHAIVHILRHRRQVEKMKIIAGSN